MIETREIPVSKLVRLEEDRRALYEWIKNLDLNSWQLIEFMRLTSTMLEVANRKNF